jgi:hypothetical protein
MRFVIYRPIHRSEGFKQGMLEQLRNVLCFGKTWKSREHILGDTMLQNQLSFHPTNLKMDKVIYSWLKIRDFVI